MSSSRFSNPPGKESNDAGQAFESGRRLLEVAVSVRPDATLAGFPPAVQNTEVAFYQVHRMAGGHDFERRDVLTYGDLLRGYAKARGLKRWLVPVPVLTPRRSEKKSYGFDPGVFEVWDIRHGRQVLDLTGHSETACIPLFNRDGQRLLTTATDSAGRQHETFLWWEGAYAGLPGATFADRIREYARVYWRDL